MGTSKNPLREPTATDLAREKAVKDLLRDARNLQLEEQAGIAAPNPSSNILEGTQLGTGLALHGVTDGVTVENDPSQQAMELRVTPVTKYTNLNSDFDTIYRDIFEPMVKLYGAPYDIVKKLCMYIGVANAIKMKYITDTFTHDMRINAWFCLRSGSGKNEIKNAIFLSEIPGIFKFEVPTSYHSEHYVGKYTVDKDPKGRSKDRKILNHKGYLENDLLIINEARKLLLDENMADARQYLRTALDPIGKNEVVKATADVPDGLRKRFVSKAVTVLLFQPGTFTDEIALSGDLRRNIICYFQTPHEIKDQALCDIFYKKRSGRMAHMERLNQWHNILYTMMEKNYNWDLSEIKQALIRYGRLFYDYAKARGTFTQEIGDDTFFDAVLHLLRFTLVRTALEGKSKPTLQHLHLAFADYRILYQQYLDFCTECLKGHMYDYVGSKLKDIDMQKIREAIGWLAEQGAYSQEISNVSVQDLLAWMEKQGWGTATRGNSGPYRVYKLMKEFGYIEFRQMKSTVRLWIREDKLPPLWKEELRGTLKEA